MCRKLRFNELWIGKSLKIIFKIWVFWKNANGYGHGIMSQCDQARSAFFEFFCKKKLCYMDFKNRL
jgi:hypothetical protein